MNTHKQRNIMKNVGIHILALLTMAGFCAQSVAMNNPFGLNEEMGRQARFVFNDISESVERATREKKEQLQREAAERRNKKAEYEVMLRTGSEAQKQHALRELERLGKQDDRAEQHRDNVEDIGKKFADLYVKGLDTAVDMAKQAHNAGLEKEKEAIRGEMLRRGIVDAVTEAFNKFSEPKTAGAAALCALGVFGSYYGLKLGFKVLEDWYGVPELADKTTIIPLHKKIYNKLMGIEVFNKTRDDIVLNDELREFMNEYIEGTKNIIAHGGYLNHILLPGPPGTGKTLMAEVIAHELGLPSIYFAASNLLNCDTETALVRLSQLFTYAKNSSVPIVIIMDESEMIFGDRNKAASEKVSAIKNQIMGNTGTEQNNFILIALTNRVQDFDKAFKSRFNNIVEVRPPAYAQRKQILELYVNSYILNPKFKTKGSFLGRLFKGKKEKNITFDEDLFDERGIESLAKQLDGFTGRNISHLVMDIRKKALASSDAHISRDTVNQALAAMKRKVEEEHREYAPAPATVK
jgi:AAA+ superfamily predicted ATPase